MTYGINIGFIGAGRMGDALIRAFVDATEVKPSSIYAYNRTEYKLKAYKPLGVNICTSNKELEQKSDIIFLCVKPQQIEDVIYEIEGSEKIIISIAAGIKLSYLQKHFKRVIRLMPNVNVQVLQMASAYTAGKKITKKEKDFLEKILSAVGMVVEVKEKDMSAITALSGSGPGFVSYFIYAFVRAAVHHGLSKEIASKLAVQMVLGSAKMLKDKNLAPGELIAMVASPGGTTEAGLRVLKGRKFENMIDQCFMAAKERSKELGQMKNWNPSYIR